MERVNDIDELIGKYLANEATPEEAGELDRWLLANENNQRYFNDMRLLFDKAAEVRTFPTFDTDVAWQKLKAKLHDQQSDVVPERKYSPWTAALRIAASVLLVATMGYVIFQSLGPEPQTLQIASVDTTVQDTLPDGSKAFLNRSSTLTFTYDARKKSRTATLQGEGYFEVIHKEDEPFTVDAGEVIIKDLGTAFNVKAYPGSQTVEVFVESGEVAFYTQQNPGLRLTAGQTGEYDRTSDVFSWSEAGNVNTLAYKTRVFEFAHARLGAVVESINSVYDVHLRLANPALAKCQLNVSFRSESIEVMADVIAETLGLTVTREGDEIILDGKGCE